MSEKSKVEAEKGIDSQDITESKEGACFNLDSMSQIRIPEVWEKYKDKLSWGKGQCLAILDDGCNLSEPAWQAELPWGKKVVTTWNSIDNNDDPAHVPPGYHGTTVGYPSSMNLNGVYGVAYNNQVAHVRSVTVVHLKGQGEATTMAAALQWVLDNYQKYNITTVNLAPLDDERHQEPVDTVIDPVLKKLRESHIWVSAPCGNHHYTDGISWPACQPYCWAISGTVPGEHRAHLDRYSNVDLLAAAVATSSSNAYSAACAMIMREAIEKTGFKWEDEGANIPEAIMKIFQQTGVKIDDPETGLEFRELDLLTAVDYVFNN
ncbi:MAG: S8 family serine peptidase [Planctomycetota bacterium]